MGAAPALLDRLRARAGVLFGPRTLGPSYPVLPVVDEASGETNVAGIYAAGELAGVPLVRLGLNAGHDLMTRLLPTLQSGGSEDRLDAVIIGAGSSGLAASVVAKDAGLRTVTLEAAAFANTFVTMTKGKVLFAEPEDIPLRSRVWFEECTKEQLLVRWRQIWKEEQLDIREHEKVDRIEGSDGDFTVHTAAGSYRCRKVLLCLGKAGNPRRLKVPGEREHGGRIHHRLLDADEHDDQDILIVGAGDVACEAAAALARSGRNRVTLSAIDKEFTFPKKRNIDAVRALEAEGKLRIVLDSKITGFSEQTATLVHGDGREEPLPWDVCFEMIGAELPVRFLRDTGIQLNTDWPWKRWAWLAFSFVLVYSIYGLKSYGKGLTAWPFEQLIPQDSYTSALKALFQVGFAPFRWLFSDGAYAEILADKGFQQGYLYSGLYSVIMLVFGWEALIRWRAKASNPRYQTYRYASLLAFQIGFFLIVNIVGVHALSVKYAWRAWGLYQPFPLFFNTFFWWYDSDPTWIKVTFISAGLLGSLGVIPWMARNHGKRFCTWICGCGGLAETLGDRWRHLSPKGKRSQSWEFQGVLILAAATMIGIIVVGWYRTDGNNGWWRSYNYMVDFWLVAVIPITLYPFFGGKVWCRYWCPLAAYNGLLSRWYGRLKIVSNEHCITCTECSKYCQVGIDVMAFAKNQQPFDNSNSVCIHCGICIDVCPMDVLHFETSDQNAVQLIALNRASGLPEGPPDPKKERKAAHH